MTVTDGIANKYNNNHNENDIEPGYYEDGEFGIRIENVLIVKKVHENAFGNKDYYG
jgi:Xaa-Pro aminopeptidase